MSIGTITSTGKIESNKSSVNLTYKKLCRYNTSQPTDKVQSFIIMCDESVDDLSSLIQFMLLHGSKTEYTTGSSPTEGYEYFCVAIPLYGGEYTGSSAPTVYTTLSYYGYLYRPSDPPDWRKWLCITGYHSTSGNSYDSITINESDWWIEDF